MDIVKQNRKRFMIVISFIIAVSVLFTSCASISQESSIPDKSSTRDEVSTPKEITDSDIKSDVTKEDSSAPVTPDKSESTEKKESSVDSEETAPKQTPTLAPTPTLEPTLTPKSTEEPYNEDPRNFNFSGPIPKEVLTNFLSRAVTQNGFIALSAYGNIPSGGNENFYEDFRMLKNIGAMFIGRAAYVWARADEEEHYSIAEEKAAIVHNYNPDIMLQACVFEAVYKENVEAIPIPSWVFKEFKLPVEKRNFNYNKMLFTSGSFVDHWATDASVPDITRLETQMWFFYRCARYIDSGYEAIHLGQLALISRNDNGNQITAQLIDRIRSYAAENARRKWVVLDAHVYRSEHATYVKGGERHLLLDFHSFPLRPRDNFPGNELADDGYQPARLEKGFRDSIYGNSAGGIHPAGWHTEYNPFLCEFDNSGYDRENRDQISGGIWPWGYDEITWFARQPQNRRSQIVTEFHSFINFHYNNGKNGYGFLQMPTSVPLAYGFTVTYESEEFGSTNFSNIFFFRANNQSPASLTSFNLENTIKQLWRIS